MIRSMTAFASRRGSFGDLQWDWDLRGVNGRGLELRLRLPEGIEGLEPGVRAALSARLSRGNVSLTLRLSRPAGEGGFGIDEAQLDRVLHALEHVQQRAFALGVTLNQPNAADVLAQKGVVVAAPPGEAEEGLLPALLGDLAGLLDDFVAAREAEGRALGSVLRDQIDGIAAMADEAARLAEARREEAREALTGALRRVLLDVPEVEEARLAQELALIAVKADVTEEIDRLRAHVAQARDLLADDKPAGRRLDFLAQEFNREANTLLSKSGSAPLSRLGLDLKAAIDQMREQVQNVE
ncbi:Protein YicC [Rubellimicrobium mesophilum DSM 19309]|uniref:Protein YicC n=1 Tax=Rubellimicrobium mesophilum DSM 19309 TaxID=442562 RepID=A0A017HGU2_9RHOB|nr:YicC/YloC family endoribonuclease [Rubellimicrobium mesophilum]EYD73536.1 Protein YicC [Rubellimicrobium mesophilum DSM 19309]